MSEKEPQIGKSLSLGLEMAVGVGLGAGIGYFLDKRYGWNNTGMIVGSLVGMAGGMYLLIKAALKMNKD
jgi:F0F1-type ATP synthase assembly protein I